MWRPPDHGRDDTRRTDEPGFGRPPHPQTNQAVIEATLSLVREVGYTHVTVEAIAARARVGRSTIYRRWPSKGPVVVEALSSLVHLGPMVDTGDTGRDLGVFLRGVVNALTQPQLGAGLIGLLGNLDDDAELAAAFHRMIIRPMRARVDAILDRAAARGELGQGTDADLVTDMLVGPVLWRVLMAGGALDDGFASTLAEHVARAIGLRRHAG